MWTPTTRQQHSRQGLRYQTDLTDREWDLLEPRLPGPRGCGRRRAWSLRELVNAMFYVLRSGCAWRLLPKDFPPYTTVYRWFAEWRKAGLWQNVSQALREADRCRIRRKATPTGAIMDSQSVKTTEARGPRGYDAGKRVKGRKRQVLVDTDGPLLVVLVQPADEQDCNGAVPLLRAAQKQLPSLKLVFADAGYDKERVFEASSIAVEIVRKPPGQKGFAVQPRRWVVERFLAWISRNRRLARDFEALVTTAEAFLYAAATMLLRRRMARC